MLSCRSEHEVTEVFLVLFVALLLVFSDLFFFFLSKAFRWYFLHYIVYWQTPHLFNSADEQFRYSRLIIECAVTAECRSPNFNLIFTLHLTLKCWRLRVHAYIILILLVCII